MNFPDPRKLDLWLWIAVVALVLGSATILLASRSDPRAELRATGKEQKAPQTQKTVPAQL